MSAEDDLNAAVGSLATGFAALDSSVQKELVILANPGASKEAVAQAVSNIGAITGKMAADAAALTAAIPAATTVPPPADTPPEVTVPPTVTPPVIEVPPVTDQNATPPVTDPNAPPLMGGRRR